MRPLQLRLDLLRPRRPLSGIDVKAVEDEARMQDERTNALGSKFKGFVVGKDQAAKKTVQR